MSSPGLVLVIMNSSILVAMVLIVIFAPGKWKWMALACLLLGVAPKG